MKGKITADDLRPGKYIVVTEWYDEAFAEEEDDDEDYRYSFFYRPQPEKPKKPVGVPFRVLAVALPFVTLETLVNVGMAGVKTRGIFDTRLAAMMEVDLEYVRSIAPDFKPTSRRIPSNLTKDDRTRIQRYYLKEGWKDILEEKKS